MLCLVRSKWSTMPRMENLWGHDNKTYKFWISLIIRLDKYQSSFPSTNHVSYFSFAKVGTTPSTRLRISECVGGGTDKQLLAVGGSDGSVTVFKQDNLSQVIYGTEWEYCILSVTTTSWQIHTSSHFGCCFSPFVIADHKSRTSVFSGFE